MAGSARSAWWVLARHLLLAGVLGGLAEFLVRFLAPRVPWLVPYLLVLNAAAIVLIGYLVARALGQALQTFLGRTSRASLVASVSLFLDVLVAIAVGFAIFELFGISVESIFLGSAFAGIVLGFASQALLSNVFAGLTIVFASPFRVGDRIGLISSNYAVIPASYPHELSYPTYNGVVEEIGLLYTTLRLDSGRTASIPNSLVIGALVVNLSRQLTRQLRVRITLALAVPAQQVEGVLPTITKELAPKSFSAPTPILEVADIGETSWDAVFVFWTDEPSEGVARDKVLRMVLERVGAARTKG